MTRTYNIVPEALNKRNRRLASVASQPTERQRKENQCRRYCTFFALLLLALTCRAADADTLTLAAADADTVAIEQPQLTPAEMKTTADSLYAADSFLEAAQIYSQLPPTAAICYNLGNCYYRIDDMARAVLWYERALMLSPGDADIRFNLDMARSKTIDKVTPRHELFFVGWYRTLVSMASVDNWAYISIAAFVLALLFLALCIFLTAVNVRKVALALCIVSLLVTVFGNVCAFSQRHALLHRTGAIVMEPSAVVKSTPSATGNDLFVLHEGTKVEIRDATLRDWYEVELADGKVGWLESKQLEII